MGSLLTIQNLSAWYPQGHTVSNVLRTAGTKYPQGHTVSDNNSNMVLSGLSFELAEHEVVGLIGLNGAGKTTFLKVLSGLLGSFRADGIFFHGHSVQFGDKAFKAGRYTVFAEDASFPYFTFREYLSYVFAAYGKELADVSALIQGFHFAEHTNRLLMDLSTGNRKKAFLITAFALQPDLLLLDEPVNGLDFESTEYLYGLIAGYKAYGTVLFSSHILESITLTSDRVLVLENGQIRQGFAGAQIQADSIREALQDAHSR